MSEIIECVPNFSVSDSETVKAILGELKKTRKTFLLDCSFDDYYNRLVVSFFGDRNSVLEGALGMASKAVEMIDMNKHRGQHPRVGAVDVVPFIPLKNATIEDCVEISKRFGQIFAEKFHVPVYLYGAASSKLERKDLDWIREGEYEKLAEMMIRPERKPDYGPSRPHSTAGATITGARKIMAGFNVNIGTADLKIAKKIARAIHSNKGGFSNVKAMAAYIPERDITQIGMSINDYEKTPLYRVYEALKVECARFNVPIIGSEFCGMAPLKALIDTVGYYLKVDNLTQERVLEVAVHDAIERGGVFE